GGTGGGGKRPAGGDAGGTVPAVGSIPATPGSCRPASRTPHGGGSPATAGPGIGPSPRAPWPPHGIAPPSAAGARIRPGAPGLHPARSCSSSTGACHRRHPRRSASPLAFAPNPPAAPPPPRRAPPPAPRAHDLPAPRACPPPPPRPRTPRPRRLGPDQLIAPPGHSAPSAQAHGEVGADGDHVGLSPPLQ